MSVANLLNKWLKPFDAKLVRRSSYEKLQRNALHYEAYQLAAHIAPDQMHNYFRHLPDSHAQIAQDLFVLSELDFKENGFFVEFGATNGVDGSNTYMLEKKFGWRGILAEPARRWHGELDQNRSASIEKQCVWHSSNASVRFNEPAVAGYSTIDAFSNADQHAKARKNGTKYDVTTISLMDLLKKHHAPQRIDYLSIDTEGSEYDILSAFDFDAYQFSVITCEHNYAPNREKIHALLVSKGYERKCSEFSRFDDWYVRAA